MMEPEVLVKFTYQKETKSFRIRESAGFKDLQQILARIFKFPISIKYKDTEGIVHI